MTDQPDDALHPDHDLEQRIEESWARLAQTPSDEASDPQFEISADEAKQAAENDADEWMAENVYTDDHAADDTEEADAVETPMPITLPVEVIEPPEPEISLWTLLFNPKSAAQQRIKGLGRAIERNPNAPSNYVLRGELLLSLRRYADAEMDFRRALDLAAAQVESQDWGVVAQVMQDRALAGLRQSLSRRSTL